MATSCPIGFDTKRLRDEVSAMYSRVATSPDGDYHFHRGPDYAAERLGYDREALAALPDAATAPFAGVGNPLRIDEIPSGATVLDIGSGAGMDLLLAATRVGPTGRAIGVDMTPQMLEQSRKSARSMQLEQVELREGDAEALPVSDASVDVVISNGVLNLTTDKTRAFSEIQRVLKPNGRLMLADIVVARELSESARNDVDLWAA
jgi:arsenite methyltransferase